MRNFDVFNGDADGICSLHQWRLACPAASRLVTGVRRDTKLLERVAARPGDVVTVFDVSLDTNRDAALRLLQDGVSLRYFDHHFAGQPIHHPRLTTLIDTAPEVCTSLLVDRAIGGRHRGWAVVGAFGDNLHGAARRAAEDLSYGESEMEQLAELGDLFNYNAYGDSVADLHFAPDELYREVVPYPDPLAFLRERTAFERLRAGLREDICAAQALTPCLADSRVAAYVMPDAAWARRVIGVMANRLAISAPERGYAVLVPNASGAFTVSVRAPINRPAGADDLCRRFLTGGGRKAAAGINRLAPADVEVFLKEFVDFFSTWNRVS